MDRSILHALPRSLNAPFRLLEPRLEDCSSHSCLLPIGAFAFYPPRMLYYSNMHSSIRIIASRVAPLLQWVMPAHSSPAAYPAPPETTHCDRTLQKQTIEAWTELRGVRHKTAPAYFMHMYDTVTAR